MQFLLYFYITYLAIGLVLEEILHSLVGNHLLIERVGTVLRVLNHLDNFCIGTSVGLACTKRSHNFLCHCLRILSVGVT